MRVLLVCDWFLKLVVEGQAAAFAEAGHDVAVLTRTDLGEFNGDQAEKARILDRLRDQGVEVFLLDGARYSRRGAQSAREMAKAIAAWSPNLAIVHENADARMAAICWQLPIVFVYHDPEPHPGEIAPHPLERAVTVAWLLRATKVVVHGDDLVRHLPRWVARHRVAVVPHGITMRASHLPAPADPVILFFGKLVPWKGLDVLGRAMPSIWARRPEVRLVVAGQGPAEDQVPRSDPRVTFHNGYVPESELEALFASAAVVVLPYRQIAQSGVGTTAVSRGIPVVVTSAGALPQLVHDHACVADPGDADSLAEALLHALEFGDEERRKVWEHARRELSWRTVNTRYLGFS